MAYLRTGCISLLLLTTPMSALKVDELDIELRHIFQRINEENLSQVDEQQAIELRHRFQQIDEEILSQVEEQLALRDESIDDSEELAKFREEAMYHAIESKIYKKINEELALHGNDDQYYQEIAMKEGLKVSSSTTFEKQTHWQILAVAAFRKEGRQALEKATAKMESFPENTLGNTMKEAILGALTTINHGTPAKIAIKAAIENYSGSTITTYQNLVETDRHLNESKHCYEIADSLVQNF